MIKYSILINQYSVIENRWDMYIGISHLVILDVIVSFINSGKCLSISDNNTLWYWVSTKLVCEQTPLLKVAEPRIRQMIKDLEKVELLISNPNNQSLGRMYIKIGPNYEKYQFHNKEHIKHIKPIDNNNITNNENYEEELKILISVFNSVMNQNISEAIIKTIVNNYIKCRAKYSPAQIEKAIVNIPNHDFWKDKMTMIILFRTANTAKQPVDYVCDLLNISRTNMQAGFIDAFKNMWNE